MKSYSWICSTCFAESRDGDQIDEQDRCRYCFGEVTRAVVSESIDWSKYDNVRSDQLDRFRLADGADQLPVYSEGFLRRKQA